MCKYHWSKKILNKHGLTWFLMNDFDILVGRKWNKTWDGNIYRNKIVERDIWKGTEKFREKAPSICSVKVKKCDVNETYIHFK